MKNLCIIVLFTFLTSCKKEYKCDCSTIDPKLGSVNPETYHVKEKNEQKALANCSKQYEDSGKNIGGVDCQVKEN